MPEFHSSCFATSNNFAQLIFRDLFFEQTQGQALRLLKPHAAMAVAALIVLKMVFGRGVVQINILIVGKQELYLAKCIYAAWLLNYMIRKVVGTDFRPVDVSGINGVAAQVRTFEQNVLMSPV